MSEIKGRREYFDKAEFFVSADKIRQYEREAILSDLFEKVRHSKPEASELDRGWTEGLMDAVQTIILRQKGITNE